LPDFKSVVAFGCIGVEDECFAKCQIGFVLDYCCNKHLILWNREEKLVPIWLKYAFR